MDHHKILSEVPHNPFYLKRYLKFIKYYSNNTNIGYTEKHHIVPRCINRSYSNFSIYPKNKAVLSARQHFIAHIILSKVYPSNIGLLTCIQKMSKQCGVDINSKKYEWLKIKLSLNASKRGKLKSWYHDDTGNTYHLNKKDPLIISKKLIKGRGITFNKNKKAVYKNEEVLYVDKNKIEEYIKNGYTLNNPIKDKNCYYNPVTKQQKFFDKTIEEIPNGWIKGMPNSASYRYYDKEKGIYFTTKNKIEETEDIIYSPSMKGRKYYYNPVTGESKKCYPSEIGDGWIEKNIHQLGIKRTAGKKWYKSQDNTKNGMYYPGEEPTGWILGRIK